MVRLLAVLVLAGASGKCIGQAVNSYAAQNTAAIQQRAAWSTQLKNQMDQYRRFNDPYTLPAYDQRSVYYRPPNPVGTNHMYKNKNSWNEYETDQQANKTVHTQDNNPDSKSSLIAPQDPTKACIVVMRPKGDWSIVDWNIVLNQKQYASIEARSSRILEINPGKYKMTCGTMGVGTCIEFTANAGSTHYITAEWERFMVLPTDEGEALYKNVKKNKDTANRPTPSSSSKRSSYSTR